MLKTKLIAVGLTAALAVCALGGCSNSAADKSTETANTSEATQATKPIESEDTAKDGADVADENADDTKAETNTEGAEDSAQTASEAEQSESTVGERTGTETGESAEIHLPAGFVEDLTQEQLDAAVAEGEYQAATLNDDGSVTFVVTPEQRDEYVTMLKDAIQQGFDELTGPDGIPNAVSIEANDDYTSFIVTTTAEEVGTQEAFSVLAFAMYGGMYNAFLGNEIDNVHVEFVNADTGEVLEAVDTKDMGTSAE